MDSGRLEAVPAGTAHLDTVRALHQTVVSLRTALETSKHELKELKEKYQRHSQCLEYADVIEKLTIENHILRRKIIDSGVEEKEPNQGVNLQVTYSPHSQNVDDRSADVVIKGATESDLNSKVKISQSYPLEVEENNNFCSTEVLNKIQEENPEASEQIDEKLPSPSNHTDNTFIEEHDSHITSYNKQKTKDYHEPSFKTKLELLSKFDVKIKVRTLKEGTAVSSTTSDTDSTVDDSKDIADKQGGKAATFEFEEKREHFDNTKDSKGKTVNLKAVSTDNIKMAVPNESEVKSNVDKFDVQVRITSEESLVVKENIERSRRKDTLNLDVDDLSLRSLSEGDNSVFSEGVATPVDAQAQSADDKLEQDNASGNESEEVDDIELIFTTDESKDMSNLQEDLVSIRETDQWGPSSASTHSTPVLIKFHTLDPDFQPGSGKKDETGNDNDGDSSIQSDGAKATGPRPSSTLKRVSLPNDMEIRSVTLTSKGSLDLPGRGILKSYNKSDNMLYRKSPSASTRRLDSVDSLTADYKGISFDNTKSSSYELGSSMDILHRDESVDSFHRTTPLGHRFSVFAETDISKCGISEDDLSGNLQARRNTCPNPFQYRPPSTSYRRAAGPVRARPAVCEGPAPRRDTATQTDVTALPPRPRWSSDGYLAYKMSTPAPTLPQRAPPVAWRRPTAPDVRPPPRAPRTDETRRVLLSDIGFTSMVPELSRSADPVWALGRRAAPAPPAHPVHPAHSDLDTTHTAKFKSRGAAHGTAHRSLSAGLDGSGGWTSRAAAGGAGWRASLPDVRRDDTDDLLEETEAFLRRSIDSLQQADVTADLNAGRWVRVGKPFIPEEPRHLRLGHAIKLITPQGRVVVARVRYVGLTGDVAIASDVVVGAESPLADGAGGGAGAGGGLPRNDGTHRGRRYFFAPPGHTAYFVPFNKVVMAWANRDVD